MTPTYRLLFAGEPMPGIDPSHLRAILTERFKLTREQVDLMFSGNPVNLKSVTDGLEAERYRAHFAEIGARVWIETSPPKVPEQPPLPSVPTPTTPPVEEIDCPYCGERQPKRTLCRQCATDIPRVLAARKETEAEAREARLEARNDAPGPLLRKAPAELAHDTPPLVGWGLEERIGRVTYLLGNLAMTAIVLPVVIFGLKTQSLILMAVLLVMVGIACLRMTVLRCNDLGWSPWLAVVQLLPYVGALFTLILLVVPGNRNENAHGLPTPIAGWAPLGFCVVIAIGSVVSLRNDLGPVMQALAAAQGSGQVPFRSASHQASGQIPGGIQVILYSDESCSECGTRRWELARAGIPYQELALDNNPSAHARLGEAVFRSGMGGQTICTPILEVDGILLPNGTSVAQLQALLEAAK